MSLNAGFGRREITPGREVSLVGYGQRLDLHGTGNSGVLDPLFVRALALAGPAGEQRLLLLSFDLCVLTPPVVAAWRLRLADALGLPVEAILLTTTHTHSGPHTRLPGIEDAIYQLTTNTDEADALYTEIVISRAIEAAREALAALRPHSVFWNEGPLGFGYNRRVPTPGGITMCWNPEDSPHLNPAPAPDPHCGILTLRDDSGGEILLWSTGAHPVVLGKESNILSADWPGAACAELERLHPNRRALFLLGPCGEVHPWIATQSEPAGVTAVGAAAAHFVHLLSHGARARREPSFQSLTRSFAGMPLAAWKIAGVTLLFAPVELFASLSARLRASAARPLLIATLANGWYAYFPDERSFAEGNYEIDVALSCGRKPGDGEALLAELESLMNALDPGKSAPTAPAPSPAGSP